MGRKNGNKGHFLGGAAVVFVLAILALAFIMPQGAALAQEKTLQLAKPQIEGNPFLQLLGQRGSSRTFSTESLPDNILSNLLWAATGISRSDSGKRTAPTASNRQEMDVYVAMAKGLYLYDAKAHALKLILAKDIRELTGKQPFVKDAALNLIYVADYAKTSATTSEEDKLLYAAAATGFISQNVYLYCASAGLGTVVRAMVDRPVLASAMKLRSDQKIILTQTVGYPKK
jgi:SagB-type dehydrogenase family enzyme